MKKLLQSSIVLLLFASSMFLFEISCKKEANARIANPVSANKIAYFKHVNGTPEDPGLWVMNDDGTNNAEVPITLPSGLQFRDNVGDDVLTVSADGTRLIFVLENSGGYFQGVWSVHLDGSNLVRILDASGSNSIWGLEAF